MKVQSRTIWMMTARNIVQRKRRAVCLICIVALLVFTMLTGTLIVAGVRNGLRSATERMGAEILVVPMGYNEEVEGLLLRSEQGSFFFSESVRDKISQLEGIDQITSQLFIQSMNAACCTVPVQLIAYEPQNDFVIKPWIFNSTRREIGYMDAVVGSLILAEPGDEITLFGQSLNVVAKLDETATGFDSSIFMTRETAEEMIKRSGEQAVAPLEIAPDDISCVLINAKEGIAAADLSQRIRETVEGVDVVTTDSMLGEVSARVQEMAGLIYAVIALIWLMCTVLEVMVFVFSVNERSREFGIYRVIGFNHSAVRSLLIREILVLCLTGWAASAMICAMIVFPFKSMISMAMGIPYLMPDNAEIFAYYLLSMALTLVTGFAACLVSLKRIAETDVFRLIKENE